MYIETLKNSFRQMCGMGKYPLRSATPSDYADFLIAYIRQGGKVGHARTHDFSIHNDSRVFEDKASALSQLSADINKNCFVAQTDVIVPALYGSSSIEVIVPAGLDVRSGGHNHIYSMEEPLKGYNTHPTFYPDVCRVMERKGVSVGREHFSGDDAEWIEFLAACDRDIGLRDFEKATPESFLKLAESFGVTAYGGQAAKDVVIPSVMLKEFRNKQDARMERYYRLSNFGKEKNIRRPDPSLSTHIRKFIW